MNFLSFYKKITPRTKIYISNVYSNPLVLKNQKLIYALLENGEVVQISQPIIVSASGYLTDFKNIFDIVAEPPYMVTLYTPDGIKIQYISGIDTEAVSGLVAPRLLLKSNNLSELDSDLSIVRANLGVYQAQDQVDPSKNLLDLYDADTARANLAIPTEDELLTISNNLNDVQNAGRAQVNLGIIPGVLGELEFLSDKSLSRDNLNVYSKSEVYTKSDALRLQNPLSEFTGSGIEYDLKRYEAATNLDCHVKSNILTKESMDDLLVEKNFTILPDTFSLKTPALISPVREEVHYLDVVTTGWAYGNTFYVAFYEYTLWTGGDQIAFIVYSHASDQGNNFIFNDENLFAVQFYPSSYKRFKELMKKMQISVFNTIFLQASPLVPRFQGDTPITWGYTGQFVDSLYFSRPALTLTYIFDPYKPGTA